MTPRQRREIPPEKLFVVKRNTRKIDFSKPYKFIYFDWWFRLMDLPFIVLCTVLSGLSAIYFGLRVTGWRNTRLPRRQGYIVVSNHCHYFDTVFAGTLFVWRHLYISVAQRNFEVPIIRRILRLVRCFPIPARRRGFEQIIGPVGEALRRGHHVLFLPEGDLVYLSQEIFRFKSGAFRMACIHQAPILPMVYVLTRRRFFGKKLSPHWPRMRLVIGEPILPPPRRSDGTVPLAEIREMMERVSQWMEDTIATYHGQETEQGEPFAETR